MLPFPRPPQKNFPQWNPAIVPKPLLSKACQQGLLFVGLKPNGGFFIWPSTNAPIGDGRIESPDWPEIGPLRRSGYATGEKGKPRSTRQVVLARIFESDVVLNFVLSNDVSEWGNAASSARLKKMAYSIAAFCRNVKRRRRAWVKRAIGQYEDDLAWLKKRYYDGHFDRKFIWPTI
jgi:hypothetical protein